MATLLTPTTELEAVNTMLSVIGESPVNSLDQGGVVDAVIARQILTATSREVQADGWAFNTDKGFPLARQAFSPFYVYVPGNALQVDPVAPDGNIDAVVRGNRLYDRRNHTYEFPNNATIKCDIVWLLQFNELPEAARRLITIRAARIFQDRVVGSETLHGFNAQDEAKALWRLKKHEAKTADFNMLTGSWSVARILDRRSRG